MAHCVLTHRLGDADATSFALLAPCACRQARYASRCVAEADLEDDAGLQQRCAAALRGGALPFPPAWALAASDAAPPASYVAAVPRGALLAHALRRAARPSVDVESLLTETVSQLTDEDVVEGAAFLHEWVQGEATKSPESRRDAAFGATIERLNGLVLAEFPSSTASARLALGLLLSPKFPPGVRAAVWRVCGLAGTAAHLRVDVDACACSAEDAELLVDDVLLCLKHDPPANAPCVLLAKQHLRIPAGRARGVLCARESRRASPRSVLRGTVRGLFAGGGAVSLGFLLTQRNYSGGGSGRNFKMSHGRPPREASAAASLCASRSAAGSNVGSLDFIWYDPDLGRLRRRRRPDRAPRAGALFDRADEGVPGHHGQPRR